MQKDETISRILHSWKRLFKVIELDATQTWRELNIPLAQLKSLVILTALGESNSTALAKELGVTRGNITGIIERLVKQGLVHRYPGKEDRRNIRLQASQKGTALIYGLMERHINKSLQVFEQMSQENLEHLMKGLSGLIQAIEKIKLDDPSASEVTQPCG